MKVLVATTEGQSLFDDDDYCWTVDGELVYVQGVTCSNPTCGCDRGFAGMSSSRATTTAKVVDRPDYSMADYRTALVDSLTRDGWIGEGDPTDETAGLVSDVFSFLTWITDHSEVGSHVRRGRDEIFFERPAEQGWRPWAQLLAADRDFAAMAEVVPLDLPRATPSRGGAEAISAAWHHAPGPVIMARWGRGWTSSRSSTTQSTRAGSTTSATSGS